MKWKIRDLIEENVSNHEIIVLNRHSVHLFGRKSFYRGLIHESLGVQKVTKFVTQKIEISRAVFHVTYWNAHSGTNNEC